MKLVFFCLAAGAMLLVDPSAAQTITFEPVFVSPAGIAPMRVERGMAATGRFRTDVNRDGRDDLVMRRYDDSDQLMGIIAVELDAGRKKELLRWEIEALGLSNDVDLYSFAYVDDIIIGILSGPTETRIYDASSPYLALMTWGASDDAEYRLIGVRDMTGDGNDNLVFYRPDVEQIEVWGVSN